MSEMPYNFEADRTESPFIKAAVKSFAEKCIHVDVSEVMGDD